VSRPDVIRQYRELEAATIEARRWAERKQAELAARAPKPFAAPRGWFFRFIAWASAPLA
jgi:hypothetical protein